jgi:large-conductance mechanosensitive channel
MFSDFIVAKFDFLLLSAVVFVILYYVMELGSDKT